MLQLGADAQGRISYEQFLRRRQALRPEIDALKNTNRDNSSEISQGIFSCIESSVINFVVLGKLDSWEWDSGARDMSPVPKTLNANTDKYEDKFKVSLLVIYVII